VRERASPEWAERARSGSEGTGSGCECRSGSVVFLPSRRKMARKLPRRLPDACVETQSSHGRYRDHRQTPGQNSTAKNYGFTPAPTPGALARSTRPRRSAAETGTRPFGAAPEWEGDLLKLANESLRFLLSTGLNRTSGGRCAATFRIRPTKYSLPSVT
jgi:hypothetical protein